MKTPYILQAEQTSEATQLVHDYFFKPYLDSDVPRSGSRFERLGGGGDRDDIADIFTASDLVSVTLLSVEVPGDTAVRILESDLSEKLSELLRQIPTKLELSDVDDADVEAVIGVDAPAYKLWKMLSPLRGLGQTTVSKLIARKRPLLVPIWDSFVGEVVGLPNSLNQWTEWRDLLRADGFALRDRLRGIRKEAGLWEDISLLRVMDVALWMHATRGECTPAAVG